MNSKQALIKEAQRLGLAKTQSIYPQRPGNQIPPLPQASKAAIAAARKIRVSEPSYTPASNDPNAIKYQDDASYYPDPYTGPNVIRSGTAYELARFVAGHREVGIVRGVWQYAMFAGSSGYITTASPYDPCWQDYLTTPPIDMRWHLMLSQNPRSDYWVGSSSSTPGSPHIDMPYMKKIRFPWGCPPSMFLLVPSGFTLRLFVDILSVGEQPDRVGGRIWGYTQPEHTQTAIQNVRHGWT